MTLDELLKKHGIQDPSKFLDDMKAEKIFTSAEENIDIRYGKLKQDKLTTDEKLKTAEALIEKMKQNSESSEEVKNQIADYENKIKVLEKDLRTNKIESAIKVGLLAEKSKDIDYLTFKLKNMGEVELNEKGEIKDWEKKVSQLKTSYPDMFEKSSKKTIEKQTLNEGSNSPEISKEAFEKMSYRERANLFNENRELYDSLTNNNGEK